MSALVTNGLEVQSIKTPSAAAGQIAKHVSPWSERIDAVRDTLIVLGLQLVFRTTMILRRWNY